MAPTLVTGGTGFIGSHLVRELIGRGDQIRVLARNGRVHTHLDHPSVEVVPGDVRDADSVAAAVRGTDRIFHVAGSTSLRPADSLRVFEVNVIGTRNVMQAALEAGVQRVIHTSTAGVFGPAPRGGTADEDQMFTAGALGISYVNSKHEAEATAMRVAAKGLPLIVVNPAFTLGPDDPKGTSNELVRRLLQRRIPAYVDGALNIVDVRDIARGQLLADERGEVGERYILGGRNFTLQRLFSDLGRIAGVPPPTLRLPAKAMTAGVEALERARITSPVSSDEIRSASQWWTYRSEKARRELGFESRPHEETLEDTVRWQLENLGDDARAPELTEWLLDGALRGAGRLASALPCMQ